MSVLIYNGVQLSFVSTLGVTYEPVYDDVAQRDYLYTRVMLEASFVLTPGYPPWLLGEDVDATWVRINHLLNTPRRPLSYAAGANLIINHAGVDANNGPFATCKISEVRGTNSLMCFLRIETYLIDCNGPGGPPYVSNRWTDSVDIDTLGMTTHTRVGQIVARADIAPNADALRLITVPPLEPDCIRTSSHYQLSGDGTRLDYRHVDQEQYLQPPNPAARAEGSFRITSTGGATFWAHAFIRLQGGKTTDKVVLMYRAAAIGLAKLKLAGLSPAADGSFLVNSEYGEDMYANEVWVKLSAIVQASSTRVTTANPNPGIIKPEKVFENRFPNRQGGLAPPLPVIGAGPAPNALAWLQIPAIHTDPQGRGFDPGARGTAQFLLLAAALQDPCLRTAINIASGQSANQTNSLHAEKEPATVSIAPTLIPGAFDHGSLRRDVQKGGGVYADYKVDQQTTMDPHTIELPVCAAGAKPVIIPYAEATARRRVTWSASKVGGAPDVPSPVSADTNATLMLAQVNPTELGLCDDGVSPKYDVSGCYDYSFKDPTLVVMNPALPPWFDETKVNRNTVALPFRFSKLATGFVDAGPQMKSVGGSPSAVDLGAGASLGGGLPPGYGPNGPLGDK